MNKKNHLFATSYYLGFEKEIKYDLKIKRIKTLFERFKLFTFRIHDFVQIKMKGSEKVLTLDEIYYLGDTVFNPCYLNVDIETLKYETNMLKILAFELFKESFLTKHIDELFFASTESFCKEFTDVYLYQYFKMCGVTTQVTVDAKPCDIQTFLPCLFADNFNMKNKGNKAYHFELEDLQSRAKRHFTKDKFYHADTKTFGKAAFVLNTLKNKS